MCLCFEQYTHPMITTNNIIEAVKRLKSSPPELSGLSKKSPTTAPNGRVNTKAAQNNKVFDTRVKKCRQTSNKINPENKAIPPV